MHHAMGIDSCGDLKVMAFFEVDEEVLYCCFHSLMFIIVYGLVSMTVIE